MNILSALFKTSIGKKLVMAVTGLILLGFVIGHLLGNLQIFEDPEKINSYAYFLQSLGAALWLVRLILLACVVLHIWMATSLTLENHRARPVKYDAKNTIQATYAARTMRWSGFIVLAFILYHLAQFTLEWTNPGFKNLTYVLQSGAHKGTEVHNVYAMVVAGFSNVWVSVFYIIAIGLLSIHLSHGIVSLFQTLGLKTARWTGFLKKLALVVCWVYFLANSAIPVSILAGWVGK